MNETFTITINLKPYAREYLINFYGDPVNLYNTDQKDLLCKIIDCVNKPSRDREKQCRMKGYIETKFVISKRDFFRNGFLISKTDQVKINKRIENSIKAISRCFISVSKEMGIPINISIREFQEKYSLQEDNMSYDTIYKDYLRYGKYLKPDPIAKKVNELRKFVTETATSRQML